MANKTFLSGNLTKDPELRSTSTGKSVATFSVAVKREYGDETDFFNIVVWGKNGENCAKYLQKGSKVLVVGQLQNRSYEAKDGSKRTVTEINASEVEFLSPNNNKGKSQSEGEDVEVVETDDMPF